MGNGEESTSYFNERKGYYPQMKGGEFMKKIIAFIVAVLFVFAVAAVSIAGEIMSVRGDVTAVSAAAKTITVTVAVASREAPKIGKTVISVDDNTLADVRTGDKVRVAYNSEGGKNTAIMVEDLIKVKLVKKGCGS